MPAGPYCSSPAMAAERASLYSGLMPVHSWNCSSRGGGGMIVSAAQTDRLQKTSDRRLTWYHPWAHSTSRPGMVVHPASSASCMSGVRRGK